MSNRYLCLNSHLPVTSLVPGHQGLLSMSARYSSSIAGEMSTWQRTL